MRKSISFWQMGGFIFTAIAGTLLHFVFDWTGGSVPAALFSAVNESIWEHLKLLYYPMLAVAVIEYFGWGKNTDSFWCIKLLGFLLGFVLIPTLYYTYTGALGVKADWLNIAIFFLVAAAVYRTETKLFQRGFSCKCTPKLALAGLLLFCFLFTVFTFWAPHIPLFEDPLTNTYGFQG